MKSCITLLLLIISFAPICAQLQLPDSTRQKIQHAINDSVLYDANFRAYTYFEELNNDSAFYYANQCALLAEKNKKQLAQAISLARRGYQQTSRAKFSEAYSDLVRAIAIAGNPAIEDAEWVSNTNDPENERIRVLAVCHHMFSLLMGRTGNIEQSILHLHEERRHAFSIKNAARVFLADMNFTRIFSDLNKLDSASFYADEAFGLLHSKDSTFNYKERKYLGNIYSSLGDIYLKRSDKNKAKQFYYESLSTSLDGSNIAAFARATSRLAKYYIDTKEPDSALYYARRAKELVAQLGLVIGTDINPGNMLEDIYRSFLLKENADSALYYADLTIKTKDSLARIHTTGINEVQILGFKEQERLQELENEKQHYRSQVRTYALLGGLAIFLIIAMLLYRNNRQTKKSNKLLAKTLSDLKATQAQLIQSEKMASLGELTAGIAHEIQNPLNFINNFSEVNKELAEELKEEMKTGRIELAMETANDIMGNAEKIVHHGKRADAIVKGMLQHSRTSSGQKELTDINALADEYLRLAYHGLRAKDKSFNATISSQFDPAIGKIKIVPQDIGRVILNLITNAFHAVLERKKKEIPEYQPTVRVETAHVNGKIEIRVQDNGQGIPEQIKAKIFQPFFTTKPTGQGTGLGLSLSYDIVKVHGGDLRVETTEGKGSEFIIQLPTN